MTRWVIVSRSNARVYLEIHEDKSAEAATRFLAKVLANAPFVVRTVLTENGKEFTDRFCPAGEREPTGRHPFDRPCSEKRIVHRLIQPRHPKTNGMVERFNGRIAEILHSERFVSAADLQETLTQYLWAYNGIPPEKKRCSKVEFSSNVRTGDSTCVNHDSLTVRSSTS